MGQSEVPRVSTSGAGVRTKCSFDRRKSQGKRNKQNQNCQGPAAGLVQGRGWGSE